MRVAGLIRLLMMHAVRGNPENRAALEVEGSANREEIFQPERLIPNPVANQYKNTVAKKTFQLNMNRATMAPIWKRPKTVVVPQFTLREGSTIVFACFSESGMQLQAIRICNCDL